MKDKDWWENSSEDVGAIPSSPVQVSDVVGFTGLFDSHGRPIFRKIGFPITREDMT